MAAEAPEKTTTPFEMIGGAQTVRVIVERFYDLMETEEAYAKLRAFHADDLSPMRVSLAGFLNAWLGGPRTWFEEHPGVCMMSAHGRFAIDDESADQWIDAMRRAIADQPLDATFAERMIDALANMARAMVRRAA